MKRSPPRTSPKPAKIVKAGAPASGYSTPEASSSDEGGMIWPAPAARMRAARDFILRCAAAKKNTLIVPDKDADGLSAGVILHRTLTKGLGLDASLVDVHLVTKGLSVHDEPERAAMQSKQAAFIIVVDQGSRPGPPLVPDAEVLIIDHHLSDEFPEGATVVSACNCPPVATSSLLTFEICKALAEDVVHECGYLCAIGTHGDLGTSVKWQPPFPDMNATFKTHSKKAINDAVALVNAPRRTATFDVISAWTALLSSSSPKDILANKRLQETRAEIALEVERNTHAAPKFSKDGKVAVLRISSAAQVHPVIATRWAGFLKSKALEIVMVANEGHLPGMVNFSCRIAKCARRMDPPVNIIDSLKEIAGRSTSDLVSRMGDDFARGHKEASGGIIPKAEFEELMGLMEVGVKPDKPPVEKPKEVPKQSGQKNTLTNYFGRQAPSKSAPGS